MAWILTICGVAMLWAGWDALVNLGAVRRLTDPELGEAVLGVGSKPLSEAGQILARRTVPDHNSLERLLATVFVLVGAGLLVAAVWLFLSE